MIGLKEGTVRLLPHNIKWSQSFEKEKKILSKVLNDLVIDIQHIGSTSIPGILAKPIIDIAIGIKSMKDSKKFIPLLESLEYEYVPKFGSLNLHTFFAKGPDKKRTHYVHLLKYNGKIWQNDLLFKDFLTKDKNRAKQYEKLKRDLAKNYADNRKKYTSSKNEFIVKILKLAKISQKS